MAGLAVVVDGAAAAVAWLPIDLVADPLVLAALADGRPVRAHQAKALLRALAALGGGVPALAMDTAIAAYLLDPAETRYGVGDLLERYTGDRLPDEGAPAGQLDFSDEGADAAQVAAREALAVSRLAPRSRPRSRRRAWPRCTPRSRTRWCGCWPGWRTSASPWTGRELEALNTRLTAETRRLGEQLREVVGRDFNLNSPIQLRQILYDERGLSPGKKTKTGLSTDAATLEKLRDEWPEFIEPLLQYREVEKLRSTYGEGLLAEVAADGRIHATFNQTVARTGRLSSDQPNLHNIPVRSEEGRQFRRAFIPAPGCVLLVADYNQIELRCIAHLAEDPGLIAAFTAGEDIHTATASRVFGVEAGDVTVRMRSTAKMVSYGLAYGMEAYGLGQRLNIPTDEAAVILDAYFDAFPNVRAYMERTVKEARMRGYTETLFGRRRPIPELSNSNYRIRQAGERQAMNAGIQGLAADIFKVALVRLDGALEVGGYASRIVLQVHDEVLLEVPRRRGGRGPAAHRRHHAGRGRAAGAARGQRGRRSHLGRRQGVMAEDDPCPAARLRRGPLVRADGRPPGPGLPALLPHVRHARRRWTTWCGRWSLGPGQRVLDVGCGPGRHAHELARRGVRCHGVDISERFVALAREGAPPGATFERPTRGSCPTRPSSMPPSRSARARSACPARRARTSRSWPGWPGAVRPGGRVALTAFSAYFAVRYHTEAELRRRLRPGARGHGRARRGRAPSRRMDLWTGCYTPRELRLLARACGLVVERVSSVEPGAYGDDPTDHRAPRAADGRPPPDVTVRRRARRGRPWRPRRRPGWRRTTPSTSADGDAAAPRRQASR